MSIDPVAPEQPSGTPRDPFNCPKCGAHDYGLFAGSMVGCPHCLTAERDALKELLWQLYEGIYGHRKAEGIDPFKTAVGGALELKKAWYKRGVPAERERNALERELRQWETWGVVEIAIRNVNVRSYCDHWEGRAVAAELALRSRSEANYNAIADAVQEIADAAAEAFRVAGIEPGEWDSDNIVQDVKRGIAQEIDHLGSLRLRVDAERYRWLRDKRISGEGLPHLATILFGEELCYDFRTSDAIDAAIDAALSSKVRDAEEK